MDSGTGANDQCEITLRSSCIFAAISPSVSVYAHASKDSNSSAVMPLEGHCSLRMSLLDKAK